KKYYVTNTPNKRMKEYLAERNLPETNLKPLVYLEEADPANIGNRPMGQSPEESSTTLKEYMMDNLTPEERAKTIDPKYFYEVTFNKPGGLPMPLIVEYTYADGSRENITYPPEIWRMNDKE